VKPDNQNTGDRPTENPMIQFSQEDSDNENLLSDVQEKKTS